MPRYASNFGQLGSISALLLSIAVLVCLAVVFVGCTSSSSPPGLYFMKVNLSDFPNLGDLHLRRSIDLSGVSSSVTDGVSNVASSVAEGMDSAASEASTAVEGIATKASTAAGTVVSQASDALRTLEKELQSELPAYYTIGLWGYCEGNDTQVVSCSRPSISFTFNISGILNSASTEIGELVSTIDDKVLTGYCNMSRAITWLYISGFFAATLTALLGIRKMAFGRGNKLLLTFCVLSLALITSATIGANVIYCLNTSGINMILGSFGASASLGAHMLVAAWLAFAFSSSALLIWLIQSYCCS
ncbi:hypothetical protein ASPBRDRAFT_139521 [Aspergillus brasiliensis CBS 101740]|uniref:Actin cortical patch SUR7/pH-response regulator PalI n=1 Tax=Aspergillus brasiliensis (strain CBS 101740 / IMI 381727 / IBT 21946) TaxID=767769 RepID=A0A1L9U227_ASPBC|nr:hypothetical protein ASPBRDRAFT_139521 [Aspergillus brasiliensis CBS 101740]